MNNLKKLLKVILTKMYKKIINEKNKIYNF